MQLAYNTTGMVAELGITADKDARDHCVAVIKGSFLINARGELALAEKQQPLVVADEHYGNPASTCVRYESDFALTKLRTDVIVVGKAVAPNGRPVKKLRVRLEVQNRDKDLVVYGDRRWTTTLGGVTTSEPAPFTEVPITFNRAWGGQDDSRGADQVAVETRNLAGIGFHPYRSRADIAGRPLPNIELPGRAVLSPRERYEPAGYGCIGRAWQPRVALAGTYDVRWRDEQAPYLPADFDPLYFQCAPLDQQFPPFRGGERIRCIHMAEQESVDYILPVLRVPVRFRFRDTDVMRTAVLDTVVVEPHLARVLLVWRASAPLGKKLTSLQEVGVGELPMRTSISPATYRHGKPVFRGLSEAIRWLRQRGRELA